MQQLPNRYSVAPLGGLDVGNKMTNVIQGGRQQNRLNQMREKAPAVFKTGDPTQIANFMVEYPEMAQTMEKATGVQEEGQKQEIVDVAKGLLTPGADPRQVIADYAIALKNSGRDPKMAISMLTKIHADPNQAEQMGMKLLAIHSPDDFLTLRKATGAGQEQPLSTPTDIDDYVAAANEQAVIDTGKKLSPGKQNEARLQFKRAQATESRANRIASLDAEMELKGKVEAGVISQVEAAKISVKAFDRLEKINKNIANLDEGIKLLEGGANTGAVDKYLPSIKANSIKLDNLAGRLGLDIISAVTFGALSESELKFAIDTALPQGLQPNELMQWMIDKKSTQGKLSDYLESSAIYLGTPGNTVSGWIKKGKEKKNVTDLPTGVTEYDISLTMKNNSMTREEVLTRLKGGQ